MINISICIPIYGVEKYIERCVRSLFEQTYQNIEYVFVNDCTKDCSIEILSRIIALYPKRQHAIKIINHDRNKGLAAARNTAIDHASGDFIIHVDSDDWVEKTMVEQLVQKQEETGADIVYSAVNKILSSSIQKVAQKKYEKGADYAKAILLGKAEHWIWGKLIRKALYTQHSIRADEGVNMGEDFQVTPRLAYFANKVSYVNSPLYNYECSNMQAYTKNVTIVSRRQQWRAFEILKEFFYSHDIYSEEVRYCEFSMIYMHLRPIIKGVKIDECYYLYLKNRYDALIKDSSINPLSLKRKIVLFIIFQRARNYYGNF